MSNLFNSVLKSGLMFPPLFVERMADLAVDITLYQNVPRKSVHILKNEDVITDMFNLERVLWAKHCYWTDQPRKIQDLYYSSAYIQDAASVVPCLALDVEKDHTVVDLCAAPGSKTLHLVRSAHYVIANDSHHKRVKRLRHNVNRFGIGTCKVSCKDGRRLHLDQKVDRVLVDAPCTGEGMVNKIHKAMELWSLKRIKLLSRLQKQLVLHGLSLLKEGGILVYSTCTFAPEENEAVVDYVLKKTEYCELEQISIDHIQGIPGLTFWKEKEYDTAVKRTIRIYPFHNGTNGFFIAKFVKIKNE